MSATALFATGVTTGVLAGGASCTAVQGGLLAGAVGRRRSALTSTSPNIDPDVDLRAAESAPASLGALLGAKLLAHAALSADD